MTAEEVAHAFGGARRSGAEWLCYCPEHEQDGAKHNPSLSVTDKGGAIRGRCLVGCDQYAINAAINAVIGRGSGYRNGSTRPERRREEHASAKRVEKIRREVQRVNYRICDLDGVLTAIHRRIDYEVTYDDDTKGPDKTFSWLRPDGSSGLGGVKSTSLLFRLETLKPLSDDSVMGVAEGEKACLAIVAAGVNCVGTLGANTMPDDAVLTHLARFRVVLWPDNHNEGRQHMYRIAARLFVLGCRDVRVVDWPDAPFKGDAADYEGPDEGLIALFDGARPLDLSTEIEKAEVDGPWLFVNADEFLAQGDGNDDAEFIVHEIVVRGGITIISAVRGLAKTQIAHGIGVAVARGGLFAGRPVKQGRVAIIDRDNPPREIRRRLRRWGAAGLGDSLKIITREKAPSLTDQKAWAKFPVEDFDLIILDSLGSSMEGVSEQEGGESGKTFAPLLDIARRGPAVLALTNTTKDAAKIRGSGVIPDRLEILYELRDATAMKLDPKKETWQECLPPAGEQEWLNRSSRRKKKTAYRVAFFPSKWRVGGEGEPFVLEARLPDEGEWEVANVTEIIEAEHATAKQALEDSLVKRGKNAKAELERCISDGGKYSKTEAEALVRDMGLTRDDAREVVNQALQDGTFTAESDEAANGRGAKPKILKLVKEQQATV